MADELEMTVTELLLEVQTRLLDEAERGEHTDDLSPRERGILFFAVGAAYQESAARERACSRACPPEAKLAESNVIRQGEKP